MSIEKSVRDSLLSEGLNPDDLVLVGVSGGPDSRALASVLQSLGWKIALAYFDHQLRPQSKQERNFIRQLAKDYQVDFYQSGADVAGIAEREKRSVEEIARQQRYAFLFDSAARIRAKAVATAHNADDQVETILMHLLRGSGTRGLVGMQFYTLTEFNATIPLVRPLLGIWRDEIEAYCTEHSLQTFEDASNQDRTYFRNRVRHELIPNLQSYNPAVKDNLFHMAEIMRDDWAFLKTQYRILFQTLADQSEVDMVKISRARFLELEMGAKKAIVHEGLDLLRQGDAQIDLKTVMHVIQFAEKPNARKHISLPARMHAFLAGDTLILSNTATIPLKQNYPQISREITIPWKQGFREEVAEDCVIEGTILSAEQYQRPRAIDGLYWDAFLDADCVQEDFLTIRPFSAGDRYTPLGMDGKCTKISDLFINKKIPVQARQRWLMVLDGKTILWVAGFQPAHPYRIQKNTKKIIHLQVKLFK